MTSPPASAPLLDGPTLEGATLRGVPALRCAWHDAKTRWQRVPDRQIARPVRPPVRLPARLGEADQVTLTDLDPQLCAIRGWQ